jgi:hypothetical protein
VPTTTELSFTASRLTSGTTMSVSYEPKAPSWFSRTTTFTRYLPGGISNPVSYCTSSCGCRRPHPSKAGPYRECVPRAPLFVPHETEHIDRRFVLVGRLRDGQLITGDDDRQRHEVSVVRQPEISGRHVRAQIGRGQIGRELILQLLLAIVLRRMREVRGA